MVTLKRLISGLAATILCTAATGQTLRAQASCDSAMTQMAMNQCASKQATAADGRLKQLIAELVANSDSSRAAELRSVQGLWTRYRDAQCRWDSKMFESGSMQPMEYAGCFGQLTEERIALLKHQLCEGGGDCEASRKYDNRGRTQHR